VKNTSKTITKLFFLSFISFHCAFIYSQSPFNFQEYLQATLSQHASILNNPKTHKLQIVYTQINRDENNQPTFKTYNYIPFKAYVYPASTVKLPVTLGALIKLNELKDTKLSLQSAMFTDSIFPCHRKVTKDTSSVSKLPSLEYYLKKMWLVSDNLSCARVYEFVGCDYLHKQLSNYGFKNTRIHNKLDISCETDTAKISPPLVFLAANGDTIYKQASLPAIYREPHPIAKSEAGTSHRNTKGKKQAGPKDFSLHNYFYIEDLHEMMKRLVFNPYLKPEEQFPISNSDRLFVLKQAGMMPRESASPLYDKKQYYDSYKKYFIYGSSVATIKGDSMRVFNIVGRAYGFLIDCAYIVDYKNKIEFLLTAAVFVNQRNDIGGGRYEYELKGLPFLRDLSLSLYDLERQRKKKVIPDLKEFNLFDGH